MDATPPPSTPETPDSNPAPPDPPPRPRARPRRWWFPREYIPIYTSRPQQYFIYQETGNLPLIENIKQMKKGIKIVVILVVVLFAVNLLYTKMKK